MTCDVGEVHLHQVDLVANHCSLLATTQSPMAPSRHQGPNLGKPPMGEKGGG